MTSKEAADKHLPGQITYCDGELKWSMDCEGIGFSERMQVAITARRTLLQLFPDRDVNRIRDSESKISITIT